MLARMLAIICLSLLLNGNVLALKSDREQPATVEADEVEYDFRNGTRTYKGNVLVIQGTMRITGDKLIVEYNGDELEKAIVWGRPASFKQRPDGKDHDVIGKGRTMVLDQTINRLTLTTEASLQQGPDLAEGEEIIYDIDTEKLSIKSASTQTGSQTEAGEGEDAGEEKKPSRVKVVITPTKETPAEEPSGEGTSADPEAPAE